MAFTWLQGQTDPVYSATLVDNQGNVFNLTGYMPSALAMKFVCISDVLRGTKKDGNGAWSITSASQGQVAYQWDASDVNTVGTWQLFVEVTTLTGKLRKFLPDTMVVLSAP